MLRQETRSCWQYICSVKGTTQVVLFPAAASRLCNVQQVEEAVQLQVAVELI